MKVTLVMAMTVDGKIAQHATHAADWTSKADKKAFVVKTKQAGVIIMGKRTFDTFPGPLPGRLNVVMHQAGTVVPTDGPDNLRYTTDSPATIIEQLAAEGYNEVVLGGGTTINNLFAADGLIDELLLTIEPRLFGQGLGLFSQAYDWPLRLLAINQLNEQTIQLHYAVEK